MAERINKTFVGALKILDGQRFFKVVEKIEFAINNTKYSI